MNTANYLRFLPRIVSNKYSTPLYLIYFVTSRCNCRCEHCFFWKDLNKARKELTAEEIGKISKSMDPLTHVMLTGGEPFLNTELPTIAKAFYDNNHARDFSVPTNGFFTSQIVSLAKEMLSLCPEANIGVGISIDDLEERHDKIRNCRGLFNRAMKTYAKLKKMKQRFPNLSVSLMMNVNAMNQERAMQIFNFLKSKKPDLIVATLVRGSPKNSRASGVDVRYYKEVIAELDKYRGGIFSNNKLIDSFVKARTSLGNRLIAKTFSEQKFQGLYCNASDKIGVMYSNGVVAPCELLPDKVGNIRDFNYDFKKLWLSERNRELQKKIKDSRCFCTHECFISSSMLFTPTVLPRLAIEALKRKN